MKFEIALYVFYTFLFIQFFLLGPVIVFCVNHFFKKYLVIKMYSTGFILPFFIFYAKDLELKTSGFNKTDIVKLKIKKVYFWINPFLLFFGKVRIYNLNLIEPEMKYVNRIPSIQKIKYMPGIGKVKLESTFLKKGFIEIEDRTVFPVFTVIIDSIELENSDIDLGIPLKLIFDSEYAYCKIDSGEILSFSEMGKGNLQIQGVTWGKLVNLDIISVGFLRNKIDLFVSYSHQGHITKFDGTLGQINRNPEKQSSLVDPKKLEYKFQLDWNDYQMPFDLAMKKMIYKLLTGVNYGNVINNTMDIIAQGISKLLKKK